MTDPPGTPRWVKTIGIVALVLVLAFVGLHLSGNMPMHTPFPRGDEHELAP